ncbi:cardiac-enriched FHL2-interacting protein [Betta splendens]|uniref:Cardiac-enriched FHL2-interacting protein n=1 Tax=Betta splendens TaxID=158456 RepID=A0A6P7L7J6_BETSP|nr:cardiac-enriched FHL2-interacting protein [Betta splendens]XP_028990612.1 cardiac-enriched FHL2-interacting protein [Betta splendens]XP_055360355.1 cardiac-enriched FHL2-interacting protein [Betta splendens]
MTCVEKRHLSHRTGSMLHHRFPNGFADMLMDETDREVSTLTDRAFRSLCVGDDAVYNDEFFYGYSPFSCHKPLVGEAPKKTHHKDCKKQGPSKSNKHDTQQWRQQRDESLSHMSSFLKALSVTEESCEGLLNKNGGMTDSNGESWDKSALRSIQKELSDFSNYHTDEHCKSHHLLHFGNGASKKAGKDAGLPSGKSSKVKNGRSTVKLKKLNIKNFFLHSELSPFQTWKDFNRFPFGPQETSILPINNIPKWYDLPFYRELTEAHAKDVQLEEAQSCQKAEPPPPTAPKPVPPPPPPKVLPKSSASLAEKRCSSDGVDGNTAPWRSNRSRAKSAVQISQPGKPSQDNASEGVDGESLLSASTEYKSVEVKAIEEVSSLASTPFSICQLMTPVIPSRQPTETSEILLSSALDLPLRPHSEAKVAPEPPVKRDSYKSLAFSILFNLKDNRKRVKSRYSPRKFKTSELPVGGSQSPQSDYVGNTQPGSEGNASGLSTPAVSRDEQPFCSPAIEPTSPSAVGLPKPEADRPLSDDYLLSNLLLSKKEGVGTDSCGEENPISSLIHSKKNKSPLSKKQNYPSLNLYRKASPVDNAMKYLQVPQSTGAPEHIDQPQETNGLSPLRRNKERSPKLLPTNTELSPNALDVNKDHPTVIFPHATEKERLSTNSSAGKSAPEVADKSDQLMKDKKESGLQPMSKGKDTSGQKAITMDVIRAAREAINAEKSKALSVTLSDISNKSDIEEEREKETDMVGCEEFSSRRESNVKKDPPPVPKRNFSKSDIYHVLDQQATRSITSPSKSELSAKESESLLKQDKLKRVFSAKQNNYIKHQRYAVGDDEQVKDCVEDDLNVSVRREMDEDMALAREKDESENLINDLLASRELERARLGEKTKHKLGGANANEEAKVKNNLISRELRNIKKGMLAMRGNTLAKKELFAKKEKELVKPEAFTKLDSNVIVNKALINDNYDKAKMALEEIIAERQKRKKITDHDVNTVNEKNASDECYTTKVQQSKDAMKPMTEGNDTLSEHTLALKEKDLKERLEDLRDYNHMRQILAQTEPVFGESHRWGGRIALPGMKKTDSKEPTALLQAQDSLTNTPSLESEGTHSGQVSRQVSEENGRFWGLTQVAGGQMLLVFLQETKKEAVEDVEALPRRQTACKNQYMRTAWKTVRKA